MGNMTEREISTWIELHPQFNRDHDAFMAYWTQETAKNILMDKTCINCRWWGKTDPQKVYCKVFKSWQLYHDSCIEWKPSA
jgi:hypothetical protein